eukprot:1615405-Rhodomonas_salina.3
MIGTDDTPLALPLTPVDSPVTVVLHGHGASIHGYTVTRCGPTRLPGFRYSGTAYTRADTRTDTRVPGTRGTPGYREREREGDREGRRETSRVEGGTRPVPLGTRVVTTLAVQCTKLYKGL